MAELICFSRNAFKAGMALIDPLKGMMLLLGALLFMSEPVSATHSMGGDITYECLGNNQYKVMLNFFRDCNGVEAPTNCNNGRRFRIISAACGADFTACFSLESVEVITPICASAPDVCNDPSGVYGVERYLFSKVIDLSAWAGCGTDWKFEWELCCRNNAITSLNNPGSRNLYLSATLDNTVVPCNESPRFLNDPVTFGCVGQPIVYNHGVSDLDGDSLTFELAPARGNSGALIPYSAGYTYLQPLVTNGGANAVQLNPQTGTITCVPSIQQFAVVSVLVKEYRNGILIGTYIRDVQFAIIACANNNPTVTGINGTNNFVVDVCAGTELCFTVNSNDVDAGQFITMDWNNAIPGATFNITSGPDPVGTFCWTPAIANIGTQIFTVSVEDDACVLNGSATQGYVINITPPFTPASAGPDQSVCATTATLAAQLPYPQLQGTWTVLSGTGVFAQPNNPTTTVSGLGQGVNVFRWSVDHGVCGIATDEVAITRYNPSQPSANAGPNQSLCTPNNQTTLSANAAIAPAVGTWTVMSGAGVFANPNSPTTLVTGLVVGQNIFRWTINNGPCGSPTSNTMTVQVYDYAQPAANAGPDQIFCSTPTSVQMDASPNTGTWTVVSGTGVFSNVNNRNATVTGLSVGINTFQWTVTNGPCEPPTTMDQVNVVVFNPAAIAANAGPAQQVCAANTTLAGNTPTVPATGLWSLVSGSGTITSPNSPTSTVTGLGFGNNVFQWTITNGPCGITTSQVTIARFNPAAAAANAGADQALCTALASSVASTTLSGNAPVTPATGSWSVVSGTATFANASSANTTVSGLAIGTNILRWTINNGTCTPPTTFDDVIINVFDRNAPVANAGPDQSLCMPNSSVSLAANAPIAPATGQWTVISGAGVFSNANSPTTTVSALGIGSNVFRWTTNNGPCPGAITSDDVIINLFDQNNAAANAGPDQQLCGTGSTVLSGSALVAPATGTWSVISGTATIANPNNPSASVSGIPVGTTVLRWTVNNGPCGTSFDDVSISRFSSSTPVANAGVDQSICVPVAPNTVTLSGSNVIFPAIGTWSLLSGSATIANVNVAGTAVTDLTVGIHEFQWTVDNGACGGITSDIVRVFVHDASFPPAAAGPDQSLCTTSTSMAAGQLTVPATGQWSLISGAAQISDPFDPTTQITGLGVGQNIFQWTVDNGPCGLTTDQMSIFIYDPTNLPANAGDDQSICTDAGNSIILQGSPVIFPATGQWTVSGGVATIVDPSDPNTSVTDLLPGAYSFTWTVNNGVCAAAISSHTVDVIVADGEAQPANAGSDLISCDITETVSMNANVAQFPATGSWSVIQGSAVFTDPTSPTTLVSGLSIGINILEWSINNLDCGITQDQVTVFTFDPDNAIANAGPDQSICTPVTSVNMNGSALTIPAIGQWTLISGTGTIADPSSPTSTISGLGLGENIFQWQVNNGACPDPITSDLVTITVFEANAPQANAGPDQEICTPLTAVTMAANATVASAVGTWSVVNGGGTITALNDPNTTITSLPVGVNIFEWTLDNGACGLSTDQVRILVYDDNAPVADAGADQSLCTPITTTTLSGSSPTFPGTGEWILVSGNGILTDPTDPASGVTGLTIGENVFQWTVSNGPCTDAITTDQVSIFLYDEDAPIANAGIDQEFCSPTNSATLQGSAVVFPATAQWELVSGSGVITDASATSTTVTGLAVGVNTFSYTVTNGACADPITTDQVSILIYDENLPVADAGADQELCSATSTVLQGSSIIIPATGTWELVSGSGSFADPNDPTTTVTGLSIGENILRWTVSNGPCANGITSDEVSIFVFDQNNPIANAGVDQQLCTPEIVAALQGSALIFPATGAWTVISGSGSITDPTSPNTTVTALGVGVNIFEWSVSNGPCANASTSDQVSITLFDSNSPAANAGPDQSICTPQTSTNLQGNAVIFPAIGTWTLLSGSGNIADANDPNTTVSGLGIGENVFTWTVFNGTCESGGGFDVVSIFVYDENTPVANAGADQQICSPEPATTSMSASAIIFPATGSWTLVSGTGTIVSPNSPNTSIVDLGFGENVFQWSVDNGPCPSGITTDLVSIFIYNENDAAANAGPDQDLCTPVASIQLAGSSITAPSTGTWNMISGTGTISDVNDPQATITGATPGIIIMEWTVDNGPCANGITTDQVIINLFDENNAPASAGTDQQLCTPQASTTLEGSALTVPATGTWQVVSGSAVIADPNDPATTISGLVVGETILSWTVSNGPCANSSTTDLVSIFVFDQNVPMADAGSDQQVCTPITNALMAGSAITFPAVGTWTLVSGQGTIVDMNDPNTDITGLGIGTNIFEWTVNNGSCPNGITSDQVQIDLFDANAPPANAGPDQLLCSPQDQAVLAANVPVGSAIGTWTVSQGTGIFGDANDPNTQVTGLVIGENIFTWTLESGECVTTTDQVSVFVFDPNSPIADAGLDQQLCVPQDSVFMAGSIPIFPATGTWTLVSGSGIPVDVNDPSTMITGLTEGSNIFQWQVFNGPCPNGLTGDLVEVTVYGDTTAAANAGPDLQVCLPITTIDLQGEVPPAPAEGTWTLLSGTGVFLDSASATTTVSGLSQGINTFVWTLDWDPCPNNGILTDTVSVYVYDPLAPIADAGADQQICGPGVQATMQANIPVTPGVGTWSVVQGNAIVQSPNDPATLVDGLAVGEHILLWTIYNGMCGFGPPSVDTVRIAVFDSEAPVAVTGSDISICTPTTSAVLQANDAVFPATGYWTLLSGTATIADVNDPMTAVYDLGVGQNEFRWTLDNGPCVHTTANMSVFLFNGEMADADAGPDQMICTPTTSAMLQGNPPETPAIGNWTLVSGTGVIDDPSLYNSTVSGLSIGANVFEWTLSNGPCGITSDQVVIMVYDENQPPAAAGSDQQLCSPAGSATLQGSPVAFPATGTWQFVSGTGTLSDPNSANATVSDLVVGTTVLQWVVDNGPCANGITSDQVSITVYDGTQQAAAAGPDQAFCTPLPGEVTMFANTPQTPATGTWTVINGPATLASGTDPFTAVNGLDLGSNIFMWTVDNGACGTSTDEVSLMVYDSEAAAAAAGPDQEYCQDITATNMQAVPASSTSTGTWSLLSGAGVVALPSDPFTAVSGLQQGDNYFTWMVNNGPFEPGDPCGPSADTLLITIKDCLTLTIPDAFSPNGDGVNDIYVILNIESYPGNSLQVFNRWGNKILDRSPYLNDWDGTSQFGAAFGEKLPESTYYYVLDIGEGKEAHTGYIFLRR